MYHTRYQQRSQEIQSLVKSINELADLTNDLRTLVLEQGSILDRIDYNVEHIHVAVKKSEGEVGKANEVSKNSSSCVIC